MYHHFLSFCYYLAVFIVLSHMDSSLRFVSYNCRGFKSARGDIYRLCYNHDIVLLQETWLLPDELHVLNELHPEFHGFGSSAVNINDGVLNGRPYGGLGILWRKSMSECVSIKKNHPDPRILSFELKFDSYAILMSNVYMPYQCLDNYDCFLDHLGKLTAMIDDAESTRIAFVGDFNAARNTPFDRELQQWCLEHSMTLSDCVLLDGNSDVHTYVSEAHGTTSWLDHVIASSDLHSMITDVKVLDLLPTSDHLPLQYTLSVPAQQGRRSFFSPTTSDYHPGFRWDKASESDIIEYRRLTDAKLQAITPPRDALLCTDGQCSMPQHRVALDSLYGEVCGALLASSETILEKASGSSGRKHVVPGWNEHCRDLHLNARSAYLMWRRSGSPRTGPDFEEMQLT